MSRGLVSLAEFYRAVRQLETGDVATARVATLLGLVEEAEAATVHATQSGGFAPNRHPGAYASGDTPGGAPLDVPPRDTPPADPERDLGPVRPLRITEPVTVPVESSPPSWVTDTALPALAASSTRSAEPVAPESLFHDRRQRAILAAGLATRAPTGDVDVDEVVERRARLEALCDLPRRLMPTLRRGVQLLLDHSDGMAPFVQDRERLRQEIADVCGAPRVEMLRFHDCPLRDVFRARASGPERWRPPTPGAVVAVVSDLGLGGPALRPSRATRTEWLDFARQARDAGCPVMVFVPFAPSRWDARLARAMTLVHWDRPTTARVVAAAVRCREPA